MCVCVCVRVSVPGRNITKNRYNSEMTSIKVVNCCAVLCHHLDLFLFVCSCLFVYLFVYFVILERHWWHSSTSPITRKRLGYGLGLGLCKFSECFFNFQLYLSVWLVKSVPVNSPHNGQWRGALMFSLICVWINDWVNNREAGDLRRHLGLYDVNVMIGQFSPPYTAWSYIHDAENTTGSPFTNMNQL